MIANERQRRLRELRRVLRETNDKPPEVALRALRDAGWHLVEDLP